MVSRCPISDDTSEHDPARWLPILHGNYRQLEPTPLSTTSIPAKSSFEIIPNLRPNAKMSMLNPARERVGADDGGRIATLSSSLAAALLAIYLVHTWYEWRKLSHVPGPMWASLTKLWMVRQSLRRRQPFALKEAHARYGTMIQVFESPSRLTYPSGSLVRVGPNEVVTDDPEVLRKIMAVRSTYTRGDCRLLATDGDPSE